MTRMPKSRRKKEGVKTRHVGVWIVLLCVMLVSWTLNSFALDWGQTGDVSWSPDSIEGRITAIYLPQLSKVWTHKYPRGHYLVSAIFYKPMIKKWESSPVVTRLPNGKLAQTSLNQERLYQLASVSRHITLYMSAGILLGVFLTARKLLHDDLAAILSCLCLSFCCLFVFYCKSACVDIPAFFWFVWAGCFGLYAIKSDNLLFYLLAGFCSVWSVCTKEGVATFHIGLACGLATLLVHTKVQAGQPFPKALRSLVHWKILAAVALAALVFISLEGFWGGMEEWHYRSNNWKSVVENEFKPLGLNFFGLLQNTYQGLFQAWGLPFLVLLLLSVIWWVIKYRWELCLTMAPFLAFFFLTVLVIGQNLPRFMMCGFAGMAIMMGKTLADWYRIKKIPAVIRHILPLLILAPSLICCICYDLELKHDTRVQAEEWMKENVESGSLVGLSMMRQYAPRVWLDDFKAIPEWDSKGIQTSSGKIQVWPEYIIGTYQSPCASRTDKEFFSRMFKGEAQYQKKAEFNRLYFRKDSILWKCCLRFYSLHGFISPKMMIYKKASQL